MKQQVGEIQNEPAEMMVLGLFEDPGQPGPAAAAVDTETDRPSTPAWATDLGARLLTQFLRDWAETWPALVKTSD